MTMYVTEVPNADADATWETLVAVQIVGTLEKKDYDVFGPRLDDLVEQHGRLRLFIELVDFRGWTPAAAWEDVKLAVRHFRNIERIAVVGERPWEKGIAALAKPFTSAQMRYFNVEERDAANTWIRKRA